ncbi:MAG: pseudaminic acid synthase [Firmicutes bacterium HGW-Firmicutes-7]|nr:MAG: pseudaminic acid synthase [Firmicutes bacterium HGW-Firmicutes-7]
MHERNLIVSSSQCYIIAEMSANHAGSLDRALEIIHAAKEAGADCIKIQTYTPDSMTIDCDNKYFNITNGTWKGENLYNLYKKAYTPWEWQAKLKEEANKVGIDFLSTPFDNLAVDFLESIGVATYKIASFELVDIPLIKYVASKQKPIIISTGMGSFDEIQEAVEAAENEGNHKLFLLKCSSVYPAIPENMNLRTMNHLADAFGYPVGLSDHTLGSVSAIAAVALGAKIVEKHFCISREIENPDASFSMEPKEFSDMVKNIRDTEKAMGKVSYKLSDEELDSSIFRRSIFSVSNISKGEAFNEKNVRIIRPGYGLKPKYMPDIIGKKAVRDIEIGTPIEWGMVE